jgi:hypothetical protein
MYYITYKPKGHNQEGAVYLETMDGKQIARMPVIIEILQRCFALNEF